MFDIEFQAMRHVLSRPPAETSSGVGQRLRAVRDPWWRRLFRPRKPRVISVVVHAPAPIAYNPHPDQRELGAVRA